MARAKQLPRVHRYSLELKLSAVRLRRLSVERGLARGLRGRRGQHGDRFRLQVSAAGWTVALGEHGRAHA